MKAFKIFLGQLLLPFQVRKLNLVYVVLGLE